ncbi:hypothetical protein K438DRAFT_1971144 [Mycena galopus ATCC 62051]|nr:hypothetical protein K438DRAFT_1971144 [Mycena galopus ATCC 62051]
MNPVIPTRPPNADADAYRIQAPLPSSNPVETPSTQPEFSHIQTRLRAPKQTTAAKTFDKFAAMEENFPFDSLGDMLSSLNFSGVVPTSGCLTSFLIYHHQASYPPSTSVNVSEQKEMFSSTGPADKSHHDFGWWIEFAHSVPEGDIGRVWEIMKIWIFKDVYITAEEHVQRVEMEDDLCLHNG